MSKITWPDLHLPPINQPVLISAYDFHNPSSPCVSKCNVQDNACTGCGRTLDEIKHWTVMTDDEKRKVKERLNAS